MKGFAYTVCLIAIVSSALFMLIPRRQTRRVASLAIGLFVLCSIALPVRELISTLGGELYDASDYSVDFDSESDYIDAVAQQTTDNLVTALNSLLLSEGIRADNIIIGIRYDEDMRIYVSKADIYISSEYESQADRIEQIVYRNLSKEPRIIIEQKSDTDSDIP